MSPTAPRPDPSLPEWLAAHAHAVTDRRLALDLLGGGLAVAAAARWRPTGWPAMLAAGACFVAFGVWALAERRLAAAPASAVAWRAARIAGAVVGTLAAALLGFTLLFGLLGTWIS